MKIEKLNINQIKPYWNNPRKNTDAVQAIKNSIERYGYNSPIAVDKDNVIIAGHTRFMALNEMGREEIEIIRLDLNEQKAKEYRIIDNKSSELSLWDNDALMKELREISDIDSMKEFFPQQNLDNIINDNLELKPIEYTEESFNNSMQSESDRFVSNNEDSLHKVMCPHCLKEHYINRSELMNFAPDSKEE